MTNIKLKHLDRFVDRHGKVRYYFRRGKGPRIALPGEPGSLEFIVAYQKALDDGPAKIGPPGRGGKGTFDRLARDYFASPDFLRLTPQTRNKYRSVIHRFLDTEHVAHRQVSEMTRQHVQTIIARRSATPAAANDLLKKLRILIHFAIDHGWRRDDPTLRIKKFAAGEFHTWTDNEIAQYERAWPIGTRERLAFGLLVFTGQRGSDVAKMAWLHVSEDGIWIVQRKTNAKLLVPLHPELRRILQAAPEREGAIIKTSYQQAFSAKGFSNFMAERINQAGLPDHCVTHGLRKAAARRLAEAGCSANEIASITGHASLEEVARYTKAAEQKTLARAAIGRLKNSTGAAEFPNLSDGLGILRNNTNEINSEQGEWRSLRESNPSFQIENLTS
jgi:integrase